MTDTSHFCSGNLPGHAYGGAIDSCGEDPFGRLWVFNGEYASQVSYCPYCGAKAKQTPPIVSLRDVEKRQAKQFFDGFPE